MKQGGGTGDGEKQVEAGGEARIRWTQSHPFCKEPSNLLLRPKLDARRRLKKEENSRYGRDETIELTTVP